MATDYSRMIFFFNIIVMVFILIATVLCFLAPSYIVTSAVASTSVSANNQTASGMFYGAGAIGTLITLIFIGYIIYNMWLPAVDVTNPEMIAMAGFGWGTALFLILLFAMFIFMGFLILYAITLLNTESSSAFYWGIAAIVLVVIAFLMELINLYFYWSYNSYLSTLTMTEQVVSLQPMSKPSSLADVFYFNRNPNMKGKFNGTIALEGVLKEDNQYIEYNGQVIENTELAQTVPIKVKFPINEIPEQVRDVRQARPIQEQSIAQPIQQRVPNVQSPSRIPGRRAINQI